MVTELRQAQAGNNRQVANLILTPKSRLEWNKHSNSVGEASTPILMILGYPLEVLLDTEIDIVGKLLKLTLISGRY